MTMTNVTVSLGFNDFHAESHSVLELNGDSQIHAGTVYINDDGTLILNGENFVFGNLVFEDHSDLVRAPICPRELYYFAFPLSAGLT